MTKNAQLPQMSEGIMIQQRQAAIEEAERAVGEIH